MGKPGETAELCQGAAPFCHCYSVASSPVWGKTTPPGGKNSTEGLCPNTKVLPQGPVQKPVHASYHRV